MVLINLSEMINLNPTIEESLSAFSRVVAPEYVRKEGLTIEGLWKGNTTPYQIEIYEFPEMGHRLDGKEINYFDFGKEYPWEAVLKNYTNYHHGDIVIGYLIDGQAPLVENDIKAHCRVVPSRRSPLHYYPLDNCEKRYPISAFASTNLKEPEWRSKKPEEIESLYSENLKKAITKGLPFVCDNLDAIVEDLQKKVKM